MMQQRLLNSLILLSALAADSSILPGANAQTTLVPNDIQIVAYAADSPDAFAFVTWVDLDEGTEIFFTDKGWTGCGASGELQSGETIIKFTAPTGGVTAGSVFELIDDTTPGTGWEIVSGSMSFTGVEGDQMLVYQGTEANPTFIFAFDTTGGWEDCDAVSSSKKSALPPGLVDGVSAVSFAHSDSFWYRPWYSKSATLETLKEWMVDRNRFDTTSSSSTRAAEYEAPLSGFTILTGQRGVNGYTEYYPGTAPCIILSGHDGDLFPDSINDRNDGCWDGSSCDWSKTCVPQDPNECRAVVLNDENTQDMARRANDIFKANTGHSCHLVINRLGRIKLDPNREIDEGAQLDAAAIVAYNEFHSFALNARTAVENHACGAGLLFDFHGHSHPEGRIEVGYKLTSSQLRLTDAEVDGLAYTSSIKNMPTHNNEDLSAIIRGASSVGAFFETPTATSASGYTSVPSPTVSAPAVGESYFQGGYNLDEHGSQYNGGTVDAIQIEFPRHLRAMYNQNGVEFEQQEDMLQTFGNIVLPEMLKAHYPAACDLTR